MFVIHAGSKMLPSTITPTATWGKKVRKMLRSSKHINKNVSKDNNILFLGILLTMLSESIF